MCRLDVPATHRDKLSLCLSHFPHWVIHVENMSRDARRHRGSGRGAVINAQDLLWNERTCSLTINTNISVGNTDITQQLCQNKLDANDWWNILKCASQPLNVSKTVNLSAIELSVCFVCLLNTIFITDLNTNSSKRQVHCTTISQSTMW